MAHKSAVAMCSYRAGFAIVSFLSPPQNAVIATFQSLGSSIDQQCGMRKATHRTNGFDCDVAHCATYYSIISTRFLVILWYSFPKFNILAYANRTASYVGAMSCVGFVDRGST
jgi:hypothetical protein